MVGGVDYCDTGGGGVNIIYTDGSVTGNKGGWAFVSRLRSASGKMKTHDSYDVELMAVVQAVEMAEDKFCLVSDHWGIVKELRHMIDNPHWKPPHKREDLWQRIADKREIICGVEWMKRCSTHEMRLADSMAREAAI